MRAVLAMLALSLASPAAAFEQRIVSVFDGYEFSTTDWSICQNQVRNYLAAQDMREPFCAYGTINNLLQEGWVVNNTERIEQALQSHTTTINGCFLFQLKCVGTRYYLTRRDEHIPPPPPLPALRQIQVPQTSDRASELELD